MGDIKTMRFSEPLKPTDAPVNLFPGERMMFGDMPCVQFQPQSITAFALHADKIHELPVREFHVGYSSWATEGAPLYRKFDVKNGLIREKVTVLAETPIHAIVENDLSVPVTPRLAIRGIGSLTGEGETEKSFVSGMTPKAFHERPNYRFPIHGSASLSQFFGFHGRMRKITMRSDSKLDVVVSDIMISNITLNVGAASAPIEMFKDGWVIDHSYTIEPWMKLSIGVMALATTAKPRWVEVDVEVEIEEEER